MHHYNNNDDNNNNNEEETKIEIRPITILRRRREQPPNIVKLEEDHSPTDISYHFSYYPELNNNLHLETRPTIYHWINTFLSFNGCSLFDPVNIDKADENLKIYFISKHNLVYRNQQFYISPAFFDRPFLIHVESNDVISSFPCVISYDEIRTEYYFEFLEGTDEGYSVLTFSRLEEIYTSKSQVKIYFCGEVMLIKQN